MYQVDDDDDNDYDGGDWNPGRNVRARVFSWFLSATESRTLSLEGNTFGQYNLIPQYKREQERRKYTEYLREHRPEEKKKKHNLNPGFRGSHVKFNRSGAREPYGLQSPETVDQSECKRRTLHLFQEYPNNTEGAKLCQRIRRACWMVGDLPGLALEV